MKVITEVMIKFDTSDAQSKLERLGRAVQRVSEAMDEMNTAIEKCSKVSIEYSIIKKGGSDKKWYQFLKSK